MEPSATLDPGVLAPPARLRLRLPGSPEALVRRLESLPLVIGRAETADLQIVSNRVSREHVAFHWEDGQFWVRDLGSTNGTFFQGQRVECQALADGDMVMIADVQATLEFEQPPAEGEIGQPLAQLRASDELLLRGGGPLAFAGVWDLKASQLVAAATVVLDEHLAHASGGSVQSGSSVASQAHWMTLLRAVERAADLPPELPLLISLRDSRRAEQWLPLLAGARRDRQLVARLPVKEAPSPRLIAALHEAGLEAAVEIAPGEQLPDDLPDNPRQCWLSPSYTADLAERPERLQPLGELIEKATARGMRVIATSLAEQESAAICAELDCDWGLGPLFGEPRSARQLSQA